MFDTLIGTCTEKHTEDHSVCKAKRSLLVHKGNDSEVNISRLAYAASKGDLVEVRRLISIGVDVNQSDYDGRTALHLACSEAQLEVVR